MLSLLYGPTLTSVHDHWENHLTQGFPLSLQANDLPCGAGRPQPEPERWHRAVHQRAEDRGASVLEQQQRGCRVGQGGTGPGLGGGGLAAQPQDLGFFHIHPRGL